MKNKLLLILVVLLWGCGPSEDQVSLLHVSFDLSRELVAQANKKFQESWETQTGQTLELEASHAGSTRQAIALTDGLKAQLVSMNNDVDMEYLAAWTGSAGERLLSPGWREEFPYGSSPYYSVGAFVVPKGNPRNLKTWKDLTQPGLTLVVPHFKTSGTGRHAYLSLWNEIRAAGGTEEQAEAALESLVRNVPVFATGGRNATHIFAEQGQGEALLTLEAEARMIVQQYGADRYEVVVPPVAVEAPVYVAVLAPQDQSPGQLKASRAYLQSLYTPEGQALGVHGNFRPRNADTASESPAYPEVNIQKLGELPGGIKALWDRHFADGGVVDRILNRVQGK